MRTPSLEELAERWNVAHTLAVVAWVVALALGLALLLRGSGADYPATDQRKVYAGHNATLTVPANWTLTNCQPGRAFIEVPGTMVGQYKGDDKFRLAIRGGTTFACLKDRPEQFELYPETIVASSEPCAIATSTAGERLSNGLYLQLEEQADGVTAVVVRQNRCFAPDTAAVLRFSFVDPTAQPGDAPAPTAPSVPKDTLLASPQYQDLKALAASIRY